MSGFKRGAAARLLVQVSSNSKAALHRHCPRCMKPRSFVSSGKFRVNAQKKRIDAWLIFRCVVCDDRWNWPIHARRPVTALDPQELEALMRNDPDLAARHAQAAQAITPGTVQDPELTCILLVPATAATEVIEITVAGGGLRLDRLLAKVLTLGRREIEALCQAGAIIVLPAMRKALRRPAADGQQVSIDLGNCAAETATRLRRKLRDQPAL